MTSFLVFQFVLLVPISDESSEPKAGSGGVALQNFTDPGLLYRWGHGLQQT